MAERSKRGRLLMVRRLKEVAKESAAVNHPQHYGGDTVYEAIRVIEAWGLNFALGSVLKYICRHGKKSKATALEDLKKARWYLDCEITRLEQTGK